MRALLDEQLSPRIAVMLREAGHDVVAVAERVGLVGSDDRTVMDVAAGERRAAVTNNVKDFRPLLAERLAAGSTHDGLILVPSTRVRSRGGIPALAAAIAQVLDANPDGLDGGERWIGPPAEL